MKDRASKGPFRLCIGCREVRQKGELLRFVKTSKSLVAFDLKCKMPGRGAYLCPDAACFIMAQKRAAFQRALGVSASARDLLHNVLKDLVTDMLARIFSYKERGKVVYGENALDKAQPGDLVLALDEVTGDNKRRIEEMRLRGIDVLEVCARRYMGPDEPGLLLVVNFKKDSYIYEEVERIRRLSSGGLAI
ncbi:MAG: DUF448 domain-containing protein [Deltaproteobacteria bacterium]|nr:DUF448 domain-containing protein [Deltaproteobacteria bacterium]